MLLLVTDKIIVLSVLISTSQNSNSISKKYGDVGNEFNILKYQPLGEELNWNLMISTCFIVKSLVWFD